MPEPQRIDVVSLNGGIADWISPWVLPENACSWLSNIDPTRAGQRGKRYGAQSVGAASGVSSARSPSGLFRFFDATLNSERGLVLYDGAIRVLLGNAGFQDVGCGASFTRNLHMGSRGYWRAKDATYVTQACQNYSSPTEASLLFVVDTLHAASQVTNMAPHFATWWQGRLWCDNALQENNETLWWSELNDGLSFSLTNTLQIEPGRGGRLTGVLPVRSTTPQLLCFKERLIAVLTVYWGSSSSLIPLAADSLDTIKSSVNVVAENFGAVATRSIQAVPGAPRGDIIFLAHDGVRMISRAQDDTVSGTTLPITTRLQPTIDRINWKYAHKAVSAVWHHRYYLAVPVDGATENNLILVYDLLSDAWFSESWKAADMATFTLNADQETLWLQYGEITTDSVLTGLFEGWHVFATYNTAQDPNGASPTWQEDSRAFDFGDMEVLKKWEWLAIHAYSAEATSTIGVQVRINHGDWYDVGSVVIPRAEGTVIDLGNSALPFQALPSGVYMRKISLIDEQPGYMLQYRLFSTDVSDFGRPYIFRTRLAASSLGGPFDNEIT